ncbi:two component transcriptional regulator, LytTR family [Chryseobacterium rhizoplanae]|uniref:Two component transcriptional regulator, LytTR family n=1 Tax=Chryseobacterium rhizoplanae TaxID=1609531 RepID=A0A521E1W1_9FLAO|nr:LytTR family DNA-binding domain-containing protein [Chryseobacterium rhizoplanae]SMO77953.1 two component transcriptional regulator, LytTR family [Chryseobacterium rhizoplanae]
MSRIKSIVVDDEQESRETLLRFLSKYCPDVEIVGQADSVNEAVEVIRGISPELVFLDVNMPIENGFKLFEKISDINFYTVFVTAYDQYAVEAFKHHAVDYLLKPIVIHELMITVNRVSKLLEDKNKIQQLSALLQYIKTPVEQTKIALPTLEGLIYVHTMDIVRLQADDNYTSLYFKGGKKMLVSHTLAYFEDALKEQGFVRIHHQHLINLQHVEKYIRGRGGYIIMSDDTSLQVSQRKKDEFLRIIKKIK